VSAIRSRDLIVPNHVHGRSQKASDVGRDRVGVLLRKIGALVVACLNFGSIGNRRARSLVLKPIEMGATISGRMSVPLDAIAMVRSVAEVPSGTIEGFLVADFVGDRASGGGRLEMTEERRLFVSVCIWRRRVMRRLGASSSRSRGWCLAFDGSNHTTNETGTPWASEVCEEFTHLGSEVGH
jgi:hypothetical protein